MKSLRTTFALAGATLLAGLAASTMLASAADKMTVGILGANYAIESARAQYEAVAAGLIERGFDVRFLDARLDINTQVSQVDQLVDQKVDAIVVNVAGDPNALLGSLKRADAAGVKVFSIGATPGFDKNLVEVDLPSEELGRKSGEYMCKATGGNGEIALIEAIDIPVLSARWNSFLATIKEKCPDLKVVDVQRAIPDDAATARPIAEDLLTRFPDLKGIWAMGDGPALGAGLAAQALGRDIVVTGLNAEGQGISGIKQGAISATWDLLPTDIGSQLATRIADILEGKAPVPAKTEVFTVSDLPEWNKDNAGDWKPYDQRIKYPGLQ
ncbi:MAG: sugar ABC transporter substrate-binding protein [Rhizobiales bacterium]|nr:sugar ABC transporter substrate-binding protein [Hyphomicrobiales bacterium]